MVNKYGVNRGKLNAHDYVLLSAIEFDDTDLFEDTIDSLFDDTDLVLFEGLKTDYVRNSMAPVAGDPILVQKMIQDILSGKELNPEEEFAVGVTMQAAFSGKGCSQVQETNRDCFCV